MNLFRHPRRLGFIAFNAIAIVLFVSWILLTQDSETLVVFDLPLYALGYVGIVFLAVAWITAWIAWAWMVTARRLRHRT